jgi:ABC-type nickel/cobalt efflux system permease component RcnA
MSGVVEMIAGIRNRISIVALLAVGIWSVRQQFQRDALDHLPDNDVRHQDRNDSIQPRERDGRHAKEDVQADQEGCRD